MATPKKPGGNGRGEAGLVKPRPIVKRKPRKETTLYPKNKLVPKAEFLPALENALPQSEQPAPALTKTVTLRDSLRDTMANDLPAAEDTGSRGQGYGSGNKVKHESNTYAASYGDQADSCGGYSAGATDAYRDYAGEGNFQHDLSALRTSAGGTGYSDYDLGGLQGTGGTTDVTRYNDNFGELREAGEGVGEGAGGSAWQAFGEGI